METETSRRATTDGVTERTLSRAAAVCAAVVLVGAVITSVSSTGAGTTAKSLGFLLAVVSGVALVVFGFLGRGSLMPPVWLLALLSALCTTSFSEVPNNGGLSRVFEAALLGVSVVVAAVTSQYASDRRFATPVMPGQILISARTLLLQVGSAALGLGSAFMVSSADERVAYFWFFAGVVGLFGLLGVAVVGLRR
jgi:hypothetical protein